MARIEDIQEEQYIRHKLYSGSQSSFRRYAELVVGSASPWALLRYELITTLLGPIPGALGLVLRRIFYPLLFRRVGRGVVFGRSLVLRNPGRIDLGDRVMIDDHSVLDARGAGEEGVVIGDEVVINRGVSIQAKTGPIRIGSHCDIGAQGTVISQGGTYIGAMVTIGGGCKIGGGSVHLDGPSAESEGVDDPNAFAARGQRRYTRGAVRVDDKTVFGRSAMVLDGAQVGARCVIGTGVIVRQDVPDDSVVMPQPGVIIVPRDQFGHKSGQGEETEEGAPSAPVRERAEPASAAPEGVADFVFQALDEINEQLPPARRLAKDLDADLLEPEGPLDSLGLMNLVVAIEQVVQAETGRVLNLADGITDSDGPSPFATVGSLASHVEGLLEKGR